MGWRAVIAGAFIGVVGCGDTRPGSEGTGSATEGGSEGSADDANASSDEGTGTDGGVPGECDPAVSLRGEPCEGMCGNGSIDACSAPGGGTGAGDGSGPSGSYGEQCEGADLGGATCESLGYGPGELSCAGTCMFDANDCRTCAEGLDVCVHPDIEDHGVGYAFAASNGESTLVAWGDFGDLTDPLRPAGRTHLARLDADLSVRTEQRCFGGQGPLSVAANETGWMVIVTTDPDGELHVIDDDLVDVQMPRPVGWRPRLWPVESGAPILTHRPDDVFLVERLAADGSTQWSLSFDGEPSVLELDDGFLVNADLGVLHVSPDGVVDNEAEMLDSGSLVRAGDGTVYWVGVEPGRVLLTPLSTTDLTLGETIGVDGTWLYPDTPPIGPSEDGLVILDVTAVDDYGNAEGWTATITDGAGTKLQTGIALTVSAAGAYLPSVVKDGPHALLVWTDDVAAGVTLARL